jgi:hypothetical protein
LYGKRCLFKHEDRVLQEVASLNYVYKLLDLESKFNKNPSHSTKMVQNADFSEKTDFSQTYFEEVGHRSSRLALFEGITSQELTVDCNLGAGKNSHLSS